MEGTHPLPSRIFERGKKKQEHYAFLSACLDKESDLHYFHFVSLKVKCMLKCVSFLLEQIFQNIKQEYSSYQRWRHLEVVLNQSEACTSESQPHSSALTVLTVLQLSHG